MNRFQVSTEKVEGRRGKLEEISSTFNLQPSRSHFMRGMSLIEMLTVLAISSLILVSISDSILSLHKTNGAGLQTIAQVASARAGMTALLADLRQAGYGDDGSYPIVSMATSSIVFFSALPNGVGTQKIHYSLSGTSLTQAMFSAGIPPTYSGTAATASVAEYVSNNTDNTPVFRYYDASGVEITDMSKVQSVRSIGIAVHVFTGGVNLPFVQTARVTPRILRNI